MCSVVHMTGILIIIYYLGNITWSGEKSSPDKSKRMSSARRSHDSFTAAAAQLKSPDGRAPHKSYDASLARNTQGGGWKFDMNSDDDSTVVP